MHDETDQELVDRAISETLSPRHLRVVKETTDEREEWLAWRRGGLGASDIASVLGLSPWGSPWTVWADKKGLLPAVDVTEAMEFGRLAEPMLAEKFEEDTGLWVIGEQTRCERDDEPWMRCTVDGFAFESDRFPAEKEDAVAVVEFKTTSEFERPEEWAKEVPLHYACQATWTSIVTGQPVVMFEVLHGRRFRTYEFRPSADDVRLVTARAREFWHRYIIGNEEPLPDASEATTEALRSVYPSGDVSLDAVEATKDVVIAIERIRANEQRVRECESIIEEQRNLIRSLLGKATELVSTDKSGKRITLATYRSYVPERLDTSALRQEEPEIAERYTKPGEPIRRLLIKKGTT